MRRRLLFHICVIVTALFSATHVASARDREDDVGKWARGKLQQSVIDRFTDIASQKDIDYSKLGGEKAAAVCVSWSREPRTSFWGGGWQSDSVDEASEVAIQQCEAAKRSYEYDTDCNCELLFKNSDTVLEPPDGVVEELVKWAQGLRVPTMCTDWFTKDFRFLVPDPTVCADYADDPINRSKFVMDRVLGSVSGSDAPDIYPGGPIALQTAIETLQLRDSVTGQLQSSWIGFYPEVGDSYIGTWSTPLTLPDDWVYEFRIHRVPAEKVDLVRSMLGALDRSKMYGRFGSSLERSIVLPFYNPSDTLARYTRKYDLTDEQIRQAFPSSHLIESTFHGLLEGEESTAVWVECYIYLDENWIPVRAPQRRVVPIALETNRGLYLYSIEIVPQRAYGGTIEHFEGRVFDLSHCSQLDECAEDAIAALRVELVSAFQGEPLLATVIRDYTPPLQMRFQRLFDESEVLTGLAGPYFELSTYTITYWTGPSGSFIGTGELYFDWKSSGKQAVEVPNQVYIHVDHSLQISVGRKGSYVEPEVSQYAQYEQAVRHALQSAVERVNARLSGTVGPDGVAIILDRSVRR